MRDELERVEIPGEERAGERAWSVVRAAHAGREPAPGPSRWPRVAVVALALAVVAAGVASAPGRAVLDEIREVVGVERAQPALFSLPAPGRLLVSSDAGVWVVQEDGSKRLLGDYREASWSPFGRFVVAARENELAALEPDGVVRWALPRPGVRSPRWAGTATDTRIAYVDRSGLRVVAGDGTGDRLLRSGFNASFAWQPGGGFALALVTAREVSIVDAATGRTIWRRPRAGPPIGVSWSTDGARLLVASRRSVTVYDETGAAPYELGPGASRVRDAALAPSGRSLVFSAADGAGSQLWVVPRIRPDASAARRLLSGAGAFGDVTWAPDGSWAAVSWPEADQWVFVRTNGNGLRAVSNVSEAFRSRTAPRLEGWCCADG